MNFRALRAGADDEPGWRWRWPVIIGLAAIFLLLLGTIIYLVLNAEPEPDKPQPAATPVDIMFPEPARTSRPRPAASEQPVADQATQPAQPSNFVQRVGQAATGNQDGEKDPIAEARSADIGEWKPSGDAGHQTFAPSMGVSYYAPGACTVPTGSAIKAELISAAISSNGSTVKAMVTTDVLCTDGRRGIMAGAILTGTPQSGANFGVERMDIVFNTLQQGDMEIDLEGAAAGDSMGRGGIPGEVDRHTGQTILRVAVATAVDVAIAAAGGGVWGPLIGTPSRAVNDWASQALNRQPVISIDGSQNRIPITIITRKSIAL